MTGSKVYFMEFHHKEEVNFIDKFQKFIRKTGMENIDFEKKYVAIKLHFGEYGNMVYLRPGYARVIAEIVKEHNGIPFATDCNTLYAGKRKNAVEHLDTAAANGFNPLSLGCNVIIGDGLKGDDDVEIPIDGEFFKTAKIGRAIADSDVIITVSHFKCHELGGFGGAIKNMAMGCASRRGKMDQHANGKVKIDAELCRGCGQCVKSCGSNAISIEKKKSVLDAKKCTGCGLCIPACRFDAISAPFGSNEDMCKKMAEYAYASIVGKPNFHIAVVADVSPYCDCRPNCELPIVPNVGVLASFDPVALDVACADLVNKQVVIPGSQADVKGCRDIFTRIHPETDWHWMTDHAEKLGMGVTEYELIKLD